MGKGYATISSANNKELPAQLHYDHHFCKIQTFNKEQRNIDDILASSFVSIETKKNDIMPSKPSGLVSSSISTSLMQQSRKDQN